jgi:hypothetical protein
MEIVEIVEEGVEEGVEGVGQDGEKEMTLWPWGNLQNDQE